jgi:GT2 family glycosyltransferase
MHSDGDEPLVSVLMPVYNAATTLEEAVRSVIDQDIPDWELLAIDDGSTDRSGTMLQAMRCKERRIRVFRWRHRGIVGALQTVAAEARGRYFARMDADDVARPDRLRLQMACFASDPALGVCGGRVRMTGESIGSGRRRYEDWVNALITHDDIVREIFVECPIPHPTFMISRDWYERVGGYRETPWPEDYDLILRLWRAGARLAKPDAVILDWRDHPKRLSMNDPRYSEAAFRALKRHYLAQIPARAGRPLYQWGAGEVGKRWLREWGSPSSSPIWKKGVGEYSPASPPLKGDLGGCSGIQCPRELKSATPEAVVDINPRKVGRRIHGVRVIAPEELPPPHGCFIVVTVGTPGARDEIRETLQKRHFLEGRDYLFLA